MERPGPVNDYKYTIMRAMPLQNTASHQRESVQSAKLTSLTPPFVFGFGLESEKALQLGRWISAHVFYQAPKHYARLIFIKSS